MSGPYYDDGRAVLYSGDCLQVLAQIADASIDSVVCDPPYGLEFMGREWDSFKPPSARFRTRVDGRTNPAEGKSTVTTPEAYIAGQPFQAWCQAWATECLRVLKPGGHLLAFGGTRTYHRLVCGIEDAGFEIRDSITWMYGSGFPKSLDVSKAIDARPGVHRHREFAVHLIERREVAGLSRADVSERVVGSRSGACWNWEHHQFPEYRWWPALADLLDLDPAWGDVIAHADREVIAQRMTGIGTGRGGVPIMGDGSRDVTAPATNAAHQWSGWGTALKPASEPIVVARKPLSGTVAATVLEYGVGALNIDGCRVEGGQISSAGGSRRSGGIMGSSAPLGGWEPTHAGRWPSNVILSHIPKCAETCQPGCPVRALDEQTGTLASGANPTRRGSDKFRDAYGEFTGQEECIAARGADSGGASRFFPTFRYEAKADSASRPMVGDTRHPTVKPVDLMRWLIRLVTPPDGLVLDPFAGSGTTGEAARLEGARCILIEREPDYLPLIVQRLTKRADPVAHLESKGEDLGLFGLLDLGSAS